MSTSSNLFPGIGDVLMDRYRIEAFLARGGMGVVMRARQLSMDREVAIKMVLPEYAANEKTLARFDREVRLAKQLRHPHIVELYDYGATAGGVLYLVMEFLEGQDLKTVLRREKRLSVGRAGTIALQVLDALAEAHANDIVHRDLKPSNIFVTPMRRLGDFAKLLDFGIAKSLAEDASEVTAAGEICGTSAYMAPEMFIQGAVDTTIDVYAMGLIFLEMLLGKKVFAGQSSAETLVLHLRKEVVVPEPFTSTTLAQVLRKATAKHPRDRYRNAAQFLEELEPAVASLDPDMRVGDSVAAGYVQDLSTDSALLEQILQGPWASGMTDAESGSSDVLVIPGGDSEGPDAEFDAAVTQLIELARKDLTSPSVASPRLPREVGDTIKMDSPLDEEELTGSDLSFVAAAPPVPPALSSQPPDAMEEDRPSPPIVMARDETTSPGVDDVATGRVASVGPELTSAVRSPVFQIGIIAFAALLFGVFVLVLLRGDGDEPEDSTPSVVATVEATPPQDTPVVDPSAEQEPAEVGPVEVEEPEREPEPEEPKAPATFLVRVESEPAGAEIFSDDDLLGKTPAELAVPRDEIPAEWRLELDGYEPANVDVEPTEARSVVRATLTKLPEPEPEPEPARPSGRPKKVSVDKIVVPKFD